MSGPSTSVIICAHADRRWNDLIRAVSSAVNQRPPVEEVVIVIDHNPVLLDRAGRRWSGTPGPGPYVRVIASSGPPGLSGARNSGVAMATGELVAFLDDDAEAEENWIASLLRPFGDVHVMGTGGKVDARFRGRAPSWWPPEFNWVVGCSWTGLPGEEHDVRNVIGCNMAFRRDAVVSIGGFSTTTGRDGGRPTGCEETDLCLRLRHRSPSGRIVYVPSAAVRHHIDPERLTWSYFRRRCYWEGRSKAVVTQRNGAEVALASERNYMTRVIPRGVARGIRDAAAGQADGLGRAVAMVAGVAITGAGYAHGRVRGRA